MNSNEIRFQGERNEIRFQGSGCPKILGNFFFGGGGGISRISCMKFGER